MCLAVPMRLIERNGETGIVDAGGTRREVALTLLPDAKIGGYLLIHAGFAIRQIDEDEAAETIKLLSELAASLPINTK